MKLVLCFALLQIMGACGGKDSPDSGGPPPPPVYDYEEQEPNNGLWTAQAITVLPKWDSRTIQGHHWLPADTDCYWFFLEPPIGVETVRFNMVLETDPTLLPKIRLWQTRYDLTGNSTGHILRGTWVGEDGYLFIDEFDVAYGGQLADNDLIIELIPWSGIRDTPLVDDEYLLDFWCN